jgi:hypothetical protein
MRPRQIEERRPAGDEKLQERQHVSLADPEKVLLLDTADAIERSPRLDRLAGCRRDESDRQARGSPQGTDSLGRSTPSDSVLLDSEPVRISHNNLAPELVKNRIITDQTDVSRAILMPASASEFCGARTAVPSDAPSSCAVRHGRRRADSRLPLAGKAIGVDSTG